MKIWIRRLNSQTHLLPPVLECCKAAHSRLARLKVLIGNCWFVNSNSRLWGREGSPGRGLCNTGGTMQIQKEGQNEFFSSPCCKNCNFFGIMIIYYWA
jgi:hypothetical protein